MVIHHPALCRQKHCKPFIAKVLKPEQYCLMQKLLSPLSGVKTPVYQGWWIEELWRHLSFPLSFLCHTSHAGHSQPSILLVCNKPIVSPIDKWNIKRDWLFGLFEAIQASLGTKLFLLSSSIFVSEILISLFHAPCWNCWIISGCHRPISNQYLIAKGKCSAGMSGKLKQTKKFPS